jgi:hypothetical protein
MITITLNQFEIRMCKALARERQDTNDANGVVDRKIADRTGYEIHYQGTLGECTASKYLNVYPDFTTNSRSGGSELVFRGYRIDVKNRNPYRDLMTPATKRLGEADIYICVTGENPFILLGWCYEKELINPERIVTWTPVRSYFLRENDLRAMESIFDIGERNGK